MPDCEQTSGGAQLTYVPGQAGCQNPNKVQQRRTTLAIMALVVAIAPLLSGWISPICIVVAGLVRLAGTFGEPNGQSKYENVPK
jgi:hypothetical protein